MANNLKINFFFRQGTQGWSETYYYSQTDLITGFNAAYNLADVRNQLLSSPAELFAIRVSVAGGARQSQVTAVGPNTPFPLTSTFFTTTADIQDTAALAIAYSTTPPLQRPLYLRGNPDGLLPGSAADQGDQNTWFQVFNNTFRPVLINGSWYIQYRNRLNSDAAQLDVTSALNVAGKLTSQLTIADNSLGFRINDLVQVYKMKGANPPIGAARILDVNPAGTVITIRYSFPENFIYQGGAIVRKYAPLYAAINFVQYERMTGHKTGRPFGVSRGRRRSIPR